MLFPGPSRDDCLTTKRGPCLRTHGWTWRPVFGLLACLLCWDARAGWADVQAGATRRSFSAAERKRLSDGELVTRPAALQQGSADLIGGVSYQVIEAPQHVVWQALVDIPRYHRMMPRVIEARVVEQQGTHCKLQMRQGEAGLLEISYVLDVDYERSSGDIRFRVDPKQPHDLQAAWGFYNVRPYGKRTLLTYGIMADLGRGLMARMLGKGVQSWMLKTPWMVKRFVEGSGRWIYDWSTPEPPVPG
ncbi:MAG: hypothetical protein OXU20_21390 [Myxococcales bacterium]|nr:hypothetical protein [Myxococcales bacterium]